MNTKNIKVGVEIECVFNERLIHLVKGSYHSGIINKKLNGWKVENDGSLDSNIERYRTPRFFESWGNTAEIVSDLSSNRKEFFKKLRNFKKFFSKREYELNEVLAFNYSCGSHIHFSYENFNFDKKTFYVIYEKTRKMFFKKIKKSKIESKIEILDQYNRSYAQIKDKNTWKQDRREEFNFMSERENHGIEWRSINMRGIKTWKEFFEFWKIVYSCLQYLLKISRKAKEIQNFIITKKDQKFFRDLDKYEQIIDCNTPKRKKTFSRLSINPKKYEDEEMSLDVDISNLNTEEDEEIFIPRIN